MAQLSNQEIENIRSKANIVDIISEYIPLTLKGKNYFGVCPFHDDHSPSMSVSLDKQIYKCFSCGAAGNVFSFVKDYENVSFLEAVKIVADKIGYNLNISINKESSKYSKEYEIMNYVLKFYQNYLNTKDGIKAKEYLHKRGLSDEVINKFDIGLAPYKNNTLSNILSKKYDNALLEELSIININGAEIYDSFTDRIVFPIHDLDGHPVAFTGRIFDNSDRSKYFNSRESKIFKKGQIFYNYHRALPFIKKEKEVIIVEGNMDAIRMDMAGISNTIALMGTSLTKEHIEILKKLHSNIILMLDNDEAGESATISVGQALEKNNIVVKVVRISDYKDPDEYIINKGSDAIKKLVKEAKSFLEFKLHYYKQNKNLDNSSDLAVYIKEIIKSISDIDDEITKEITLNKLSKDYDIPVDLLKKQLNSKEIKKEKNKEPVSTNKISKYERLCRHIIYYLLNDKVYINKFENANVFIKYKEIRNLIQEITYYYKKNKSISIAEFISYITNNPLEKLTNTIISEIDETLDNDSFEKYLEDLTKISKEDKIKQLKKEMKETLDINKKVELANNIIELKKEEV